MYYTYLVGVFAFRCLVASLLDHLVLTPVVSPRWTNTLALVLALVVVSPSWTSTLALVFALVVSPRWTSALALCLDDKCCRFGLPSSLYVSSLDL